MLNSLQEIISFLFTDAVDGLDIPPELRALAVFKYEEVGNWLGKTGGEDWQVYPQGSFRLGTVVQPRDPGQEYDIDLVCLWGAAPQDLAPSALKGQVGVMLHAYLDSKAAGQPTDADGPVGCGSSRRCWTLHYPADGFHMDVLPAAPGAGPTGIRLTDEVIRDWQYSNPIGYSRWFRSRSEELRRLVIKAAREANVADVPEWQVRTTLQRLVQVLKWHCAAHFGGHADNRPPSILITTLAAQAYQGEEDLFTALLEVVHHIGSLVECRRGRWWVANPAEERENFADKWNDYPERRLAFHSWLASVTELMDTVEQMRGQGLHRVVDRLEEGFAARGLIRKAAQHLGEGNLEIREAGVLAMTGAGLLTRGGPVPVRTHTFFGDPQ
jgi:hypothetical protein